MKKYYLIIVSLFLVFGVTSCKKKATPEMIEKYENIIRQRELFNSYFSLAEYDKILKEHDGNDRFYYNSKEILKKYYSKDEIDLFANIERFYKYNFTDENTFDVEIDFDRFLKSDKEYGLGVPGFTPTGTICNMLSDHQEYHKELLPGTEEWDLWMMCSINDDPFEQSAFIINKNGKYNPKKKLNPIVQTCPFCIYKDKVFKETGEIKEFENWNDLYFFNTPGKYWLKWKDWYLKSDKIKDDKNFIKQKESFLKGKTEYKKNKKISDMPLISFDTIRKDIQNNEIIAKEKYNGKTLKVKAKIDSIKDNKVELLYGPYIFLPKEELKKMSSGQYIIFIGTMKFYDYSTSYSGSSDFESWAKDMDKTFKDLNAITKDAESGAMGYSFENCTLLKIEQPEKKTSGWEEVTFF